MQGATQTKKVVMMMHLDYGFILNQLLRHYYVILFMVPILLLLTHMDSGRALTEGARVRHGCTLLILLALADVFEKGLSELPAPTVWRVLSSVVGYSIRPLCILLLLWDTDWKHERSRRKNLLLLIPAALNMLIVATAFFSPICFSFSETNHFQRGPLNYTTAIVSLFYMLLIYVRAFLSFRRGKKRDELVILIMSSACFLAAILEMTGVVYPVPILNQAIAVSLILYYLWHHMLASTEEIHNLTLSLLLMQIRPHFINNCLSVIRGLIRTDTDRAADALGHFSSYLQDSTHMIAQTQMIPLSQEMMMIDNYLQLEQIRFNHSFDVEKDVCAEDFSVPPLTIQPLVENAVRHGLRGIRKQGHLLIRAQRVGGEYRVIISDNGCGFDPLQMPEDHRPHIGLQNVRERLRMMCGGSLTILSGPDGTQVTVHIPAESAGKDS